MISDLINPTNDSEWLYEAISKLLLVIPQFLGLTMIDDIFTIKTINIATGMVIASIAFLVLQCIASKRIVYNPMLVIVATTTALAMFMLLHFGVDKLEEVWSLGGVGTFGSMGLIHGITQALEWRYPNDSRPA